MLSSLRNLNQVLLLSIITLLLTFITIILTNKISKMKDRMSDMSRLMYIITKKLEYIDSSSDDIKRALSTINNNLKTIDEEINDNIRSLSSSTDKVIEELKQTQTSTYLPTPNITKMMRETILENINIEVLLSHNMTLPNKQSTKHIIDNTLAAYPNVNEEYTVKLCLAMIENFVLNNQEKK